MKTKYKMMAAMSAVVIAATFATVPVNARKIVNVVTVNPSGPSPTKGYKGSYYKSHMTWGDGIEHVSELGTVFNTVYNVYGVDYDACHDALIAAMNANGYTGWTDCSAL